MVLSYNFFWYYSKYGVITTFILLLLYVYYMFCLFNIFLYLCVTLHFLCTIFLLFVMPIHWNWKLKQNKMNKILLTSYYWREVIVLCVYIKQNTLLLKLLALFSPLTPLFRLFHPAAVFCHLNQQVAEGTVGNLYRSLAVPDLLAVVSLSLSLSVSKYLNFTATFPTSYLH